MNARGMKAPLSLTDNWTQGIMLHSSLPGISIPTRPLMHQKHFDASINAREILDVGQERTC